MVFLHPCSLGLYLGIQLRTNLPSFMIFFVKLWIQEKKYVWYFVMSARHSTVFGLLCKLRAAGISGSLLSWFESYLSERGQRVILPGTQSDWNYIYAGVPQGSILGPLLFLLFINDIVKDIQSNISLFADDTSLFIVVENPDTAAQTLNSDLEKKIQNGPKTGLLALILSKQKLF